MHKTSVMGKQTAEVAKRQEVSNWWRCAECGGYLERKETVSSDAHATESYECIACGATPILQYGPGADNPTKYGQITDAG